MGVQKAERGYVINFRKSKGFGEKYSHKIQYNL